MQDLISPAEQVTRVASLLGLAVLRWQSERNGSAGSLEIVSNSLPDRLEASPISLLSVSGRNDRARDSVETGSSCKFVARRELPPAACLIETC